MGRQAHLYELRRKVKFYDLHRSPITCPKCGIEVEIDAARPNRRRPSAPAPAVRTPPANEEVDVATPLDEAADDGEETIDDLDGDDLADAVAGTG